MSCWKKNVLQRGCIDPLGFLGIRLKILGILDICKHKPIPSKTNKNKICKMSMIGLSHCFHVVVSGSAMASVRRWRQFNC